MAVVVPILGAALFLFATISIYFRKAYWERTTLVSNCSQNNFGQIEPSKLFPVHLDPEVVSALPRDEQNLIVYTGSTPFVGAGADLGGWSFVVDPSKPVASLGNSDAPIPFQVEDLYEAISHRIADLHLQGAVLKDFFFVSGREIRTDREILPDIYGRPVQFVDPALMRKYVVDSDARIRHYKWIRVHDWDQELVMSYFLRCSIRGGNMFVEIHRFLLTPIAEKYHHVDTLTSPRADETMRMLFTAIFVGPLYASISPLIMFGRATEALGALSGGKERERRRTIENNPQFDYGAGKGIRQAFSSGQFAHYFQKADGDFYTKMLEHTILDEIITFLDEHHVDTSELRERQTTILNSGIIVQGGDVRAESLAVGAGSQAIKTQNSAGSTQAR